jgi:cytoskeletal protein RodZ
MRLVDIAKSTRVGIHHLAALEHEDFDALPNDVFVKGYIRVYAECLGLDPDGLVEEYLRLARENRPEQGSNGEDPVLREMSRLLVPAEERGFRLRPLLAVGGVLVVLAVLVGLWMIGSGDDTQIASGQAEIPRAIRPDVTVDSAAVQTTPAKDAPPPAEPTPPVNEPVPQKQSAKPANVETRSVTPPEVISRQPPPEPQVTPANLSIPSFGVGTGVENRQLVGEANSFPAGTRVFFWTRVLGGRNGDTIRHVWLHEGRVIAGTKLRLGGSHWRTQSRKTLRALGRWAVEARDAAGNVLASTQFDCVRSN